jgi:hypothetical protein
MGSIMTGEVRESGSARWLAVRADQTAFLTRAAVPARPSWPGGLCSTRTAKG